MARSIFVIGFANREPWTEMRAGIPVHRMTRSEVDRDRGAVLRRLPVPPQQSVGYPYVVKIQGEGEYLVHADGTASFFSARAGRWEPPEPIDTA